MGTRELKKAATRQSLVDAAARLFAERGVEATTMDEIARVAGTSRTSVFNYFGYKEMILCEIGARYVAEVAGTALASRHRAPRRQLMELADAVANLTERQPELLAAIAREMTHPDPERRRQAAAVMQYDAVVSDALDSIEATGRLRDSRHRTSHARILIDTLAGTVIRAGGDFPMSQLRAELHRNVDLFLDGALKPD